MMYYGWSWPFVMIQAIVVGSILITYDKIRNCMRRDA